MIRPPKPIICPSCKKDSGHGEVMSYEEFERRYPVD